jgi:hypothetical protein
MYLFGRFLHMASTVGTVENRPFWGVFLRDCDVFELFDQYVGHRYIKIPMDCWFYKFRIIFLMSLILFWPVKMVPSVVRGHLGAEKVPIMCFFPQKKESIPHL